MSHSKHLNHKQAVVPNGCPQLILLLLRISMLECLGEYTGTTIVL